MNLEGAGAHFRAPGYLPAGAAIALVVFLGHAGLLHLPYYWDELGQFVPAALDIFQKGGWIPRSTVPNVHPPAVMAYLAGVWFLAGYSIAATRLAMLALASAGAVITLMLATRMGLQWRAAILATAWLVISPLYFAQSMLAQLDMPAMVFSSLALLLFLDGRIRWAALASTVLVLVKETGLVAPVLFGGWLWFEGRRREALWFLLPALPLVVWLAALRHSTGHLFGNSAFTEYNVFYPLHPVRLALALARRLYYLFIGSGHWVGAIAMIFALRGTKLFRTRAWAVAASLGAAHVLVVSVLGGAALERYLVPVLPILYMAMAAAIWNYPARWRVVSATALGAALIAANIWNPPYPFPLENNLAFTDFVSLHAEAARYLEEHFADQKIATMFPLTASLRRPEFGYVKRPLTIREIYDFRRSNVAPLAGEKVAVFVLYSLAWDPWGLMNNRVWTGFLSRYYGYEPPVGADDLRDVLGLHPVARWTRRGQWIEVYGR